MPAALRLAVREVLATGQGTLVWGVFRLVRSPVLCPLAAVTLQAVESARLILRLAVPEVLATCRVRLARLVFPPARGLAVQRLAAARLRVWLTEFFLLAVEARRPVAVTIQVVEILCQDQAARRGRRRDAS